MAYGIRNIDKFFRDIFENYSVRPSKDSWDKIADALDNTNPKDALIPDVDEVGTLFQGYKVTPSERVWQNIHRILEKDKFTIRRLSRSAVSAIVAFFSNTAVRIASSVVVVGGLSLLVFNPFNDNSTETASITKYDKVATVEQRSEPASKNQSIVSSKENTATIQGQELKDKQATAVNEGNNTLPSNQITVTQNNIQTLNQAPAAEKPDKVSNIEDQNTLVSAGIPAKVANTDTKPEQNNIRKSQAQTDLLSKSPSVKMKVKQCNFSYENGKPTKVDLQKSMDELLDRFYRDWAKKFNRNVDKFYIEAYYLAMYGSTTLIADQQNSDTLMRSYNEYLTGNPSNSVGLNFGYMPNRISVETGIIYENRYTLRNDNLTWISYQETKDSIGFVFNTIDSTYRTIYHVDTVRNELTKQYRSRMSYQTIEFPLLVGYKLYEKRGTLMVRTGILTSYIFKTSEEETNIDETARPYIVYPDKNKVDFAYVLNFSYDFNITNAFKISATPTMRYNITGMYKGYPVNSKPFTFGLGLGAKFVF
jgi:hypothetical protein